jgi:histidinol-phosphate aminotransferase
VVLRTFSKMYGLAGCAGLRGHVCALATPLPGADAVQREPLAEAAGLAAMEDAHFLAATRETVLRGRESVSRELACLGCRVYPSMANFLMFAPPRPAADVFEELLRRGIIVRPLTSYGLPDMHAGEPGVRRGECGLPGGHGGDRGAMGEQRWW